MRPTPRSIVPSHHILHMTLPFHLSFPVPPIIDDIHIRLHHTSAQICKSSNWISKMSRERASVKIKSEKCEKALDERHSDCAPQKADRGFAGFAGIDRDAAGRFGNIKGILCKVSEVRRDGGDRRLCFYLTLAWTVRRNMAATAGHPRPGHGRAPRWYCEGSTAHHRDDPG